MSASLAGPCGHPFHPILVTVPIGARVAGLVFDIASHVVSRPGFLTQGSEWLIAIGVIGALLAAMVAFLDLFAIPTGTRAFRTALVHMTLNLLVTAAYAANFAWHHGTYTNGGSVGLGRLMLSAVSLLVLGVSGYLGGKLAYRYGVRVADETTQAEGYTPGRSAGGTRPSRLPAPVIFGYFALAAIGPVVWIIYVVADETALAWTSFGLLLPVALLGFVMPARWIPVYRARAAAAPAAATAHAAEGTAAVPAERHIPLPVVLAHGLFAVITLVLVLLTALGIGGS
uniref:DUF2231 domain-containing protein n=1 Tax=Streptomyces sp. NBC_00003 TaxID=2903608 RepID=A0AAU2VEZ9_9ACTN